MAAEMRPLPRAALADDPYRSRTNAVAEVVSRVDPVVYRDANISGPLAAAQVDRYERTGFLELADVFGESELVALQAEMRQLRAAHGRLAAETLILEPGGNELRSIFQIHTQSTLLGRLACDHRLVAVARQLLGEDVYMHQSRLNYKPGLFGKEFYWHSDFETWHIEDGMPRMRALSMSISLVPNTHFNGPLMVIPGSHRQYVRCVGETPEDHYKHSLRKQEYGIPDPQSLELLYAQGGIAAPIGPAGSVVIFDCNAMHGSNSNISPLPRSNVFLVYNGVSNRLVAPFGGQAPRPEYIASRRDCAALEPRSGPLG